MGYVDNLLNTLSALIVCVSCDTKNEESEGYMATTRSTAAKKPATRKPAAKKPAAKKAAAKKPAARKPAVRRATAG